MTGTIKKQIEEMNQQARLAAIGDHLDRALNQGAVERETGFVLLTFTLGQPSGSDGRYVSNIQREDVLSALRELLGLLERAGPRVPPVKH